MIERLYERWFPHIAIGLVIVMVSAILIGGVFFRHDVVVCRGLADGIDVTSKSVHP